MFLDPIPLKSVRLCSSNSVSTDTEVNAELSSGQKERFNWFKNWWPVQVEDSLKTDRPNKITLLGNDYIVWKGHSGDWIAMDDQCPHRMAPLSEGRIEKDGNLLCSYHAWRFNECGKCVKIPHAESEAAHTVACNSPRSSVQTYPCKVRGALLWIWPDKSATARIESELNQIPIENDLADFLEQSSRDGTYLPYVRYLPYGFDTLMENVNDPVHFTISHHGLLPGLSRYNAKPVYARSVSGASELPVTAAMDHHSQRSPNFKFVNEYRSPGIIILSSVKEQLSERSMRLFVTAAPVSPRKSLVIHIQVSEKAIKHGISMNPIQSMFKSMIVAFGHGTYQNRLFDGDSVFLHEQDKKIKKQGNRFSARKAYFIPSTADMLVLSFREWFENEGQHGNAYGESSSHFVAEELTRSEMLDRYEQHTKHCKVCTQTLNTMKWAISVSKAVALASLALAGILVFHAISAPIIDWKTLLKNYGLWVSLGVSMVFSSIGNYIEKKIIPIFVFEDHVHADLD